MQKVAFTGKLIFKLAILERSYFSLKLYFKKQCENLNKTKVLVFPFVKNLLQFI